MPCEAASSLQAAQSLLVGQDISMPLSYSTPTVSRNSSYSPDKEETQREGSRAGHLIIQVPLACAPQECSESPRTGRTCDCPYSPVRSSASFYLGFLEPGGFYVFSAPAPLFSLLILVRAAGSGSGLRMMRLRAPSPVFAT